MTSKVCEGVKTFLDKATFQSVHLHLGAIMTFDINSRENNMGVEGEESGVGSRQSIDLPWSLPKDYNANNETRLLKYGEFRIRDLNDEINKLLREKRHWEVQIKDLGGPDYQRVGPKMLDHEGKEVPGNRGYKYFGAAKELPGVRELFEQEPPMPPRKTRAELMKDVDADYYGYRDDDDGVLIPLEQLAEKTAKQEAVTQWKAKKEDGNIETENEEENIYNVQVSSDEEEQNEDSLWQKFAVHVPVPSQQDVEQALLRRRKRELLERYGVPFEDSET
ncbi:hypothetical protein FQA39_LY08600 [Lamprigera yunnana]|nr:hypothetical protein FQA39_LY08600 [Lamprigera yunnana]